MINSIPLDSMFIFTFLGDTGTVLWFGEIFSATGVLSNWRHSDGYHGLPGALTSCDYL